MSGAIRLIKILVVAGLVFMGVIAGAIFIGDVLRVDLGCHYLIKERIGRQLNFVRNVMFDYSNLKRDNETWGLVNQTVGM